MPDLSISKEEVRKWQQRIDLSEEWRKPQADKWKRYLEYLNNEFFKNRKRDDDLVYVNLVHPNVRIIIPATYSKNPDVIVKARKKEYEAMAENIDEVLKYFIKELALKEEFKSILFDGIICGQGWVKCGYQTKFGESLDEEGQNNVIDQVVDFIKGIFNGNQEADPEEAYALARSWMIEEESPWVRRVSPFDIFSPAFSIRDDEMPWISERICMPITDWKNNPNYKNTDQLKASTTAHDILKQRNPGWSSVTSISDEDSEYAVGYEIWDRRTNRVITIPEDGEEALEVKENAYTFLNTPFPYRRLMFNTVTDQYYATSDIQPWEPQLEELADMRTKMNRHVKRYNRKYLMKDTALDEEGINDLKKGEDGVVIKTTEDNLDNAVKPLQDAPLSQDVYAYEARIGQDITNISGITDYQRGSTANGAKTATEASIVESQSKFRSDERLDIMGTFVQWVLRDLALICIKYLSPDRVQEILGADAATWEQLDDPTKLRNECYIDIIFGSTVPINRDVRSQQYLGFYSLAKDDPFYNPVKIRAELLRQVMDINDPEDWLAPQAAAQVLQQNQVDAALAQTRKMQGEGANGPGRGTPPEQAATDGVPSGASIQSGMNRMQPPEVPGGPGGGTLYP